MSGNKPPLVKPKTVPNINKNGGVNNNVPKIDNSILVKSMEVFKADPNPSTQNAFISQLFKARLFVPCTKVGQDDDKKQVKLQFMLLKNKNGESLFGAFTDWDQIRKQQNPPKEAAALPFTELIKAAAAQKGTIKGIIINPFEHGLLLDEKTIGQMNDNIQKAVEKIKAGQVASPEGASVPLSQPAASQTADDDPLGDVLYIGEPLEEPYDLLSEYSKYFKSVKGVQSAYYLLIYRSEKGEPTPLVVVDFKGDKETKDRLYKEIEDIYNENIYKENIENPLKLTIMSAGEKLAKDGIINKKPFYQRKVFGIF
ncbi:MAG: enhanced serine sensitivity protein SseB [Clostridiales bacterium]|nr:enhanced serine sensitivity protein SseB [Clostridiales bacterium]